MWLKVCNSLKNTNWVHSHYVCVHTYTCLHVTFFEYGELKPRERLKTKLIGMDALKLRLGGQVIEAASYYICQSLSTLLCHLPQISILNCSNNTPLTLKTKAHRSSATCEQCKCLQQWLYILLGIFCVTGLFSSAQWRTRTKRPFSKCYQCISFPNHKKASHFPWGKKKMRVNQFRINAFKKCKHVFFWFKIKSFL